MINEHTYAWVFLSISKEPCKLDEIIGLADAINHAIPTQKELQSSLGWLITNQYILKNGKSYQLSKKGVELRERVRSKKGSIFCSWEAVEKEFTKIPSLPASDEELTTQEVEDSYKTYNKWFWETYERISKK